MADNWIKTARSLILKKSSQNRVLTIQSHFFSRSQWERALYLEVKGFIIYALDKLHYPALIYNNNVNLHRWAQMCKDYQIIIEQEKIEQEKI